MKFSIELKDNPTSNIAIVIIWLLLISAIVVWAERQQGAGAPGIGVWGF